MQTRSRLTRSLEVVGLLPSALEKGIQIRGLTFPDGAYLDIGTTAWFRR
jgi:hypothetical protein